MLGRLLWLTVDHRLAQHGYNHTQARILLALRRESELRMQDIAGIVHVEPPSITRALQLLERRDLVRRFAHPTDGRASLFELSATGQSAAARVEDLMRGVSAELEGALAEDELASLRAVLPTLFDRVIRMKGME